jgi:hypothetical protein
MSVFKSIKELLMFLSNFIVGNNADNKETKITIVTLNITELPLRI